MNLSGPIDIKDHVAIVTGGARGIGCAISRTFAREGAHVIIADLLDGKETSQELQKEFPNIKSYYIQTDVTKRKDVQRVVNFTIEQFGKCDILVNSAGTCVREGFENMTEDQWDLDINTHLKGTFLMCQETIFPHMKERGYGKVINISSISGKIGGLFSKNSDEETDQGRSGPAYATAKGGVINLSKWMAKDVGRFGIYVNSVAPGPIETELSKGFDYETDDYPIPRIGKSDDIAEAVLFLASPASNYITGFILNVDGGYVMDS